MITTTKDKHFKKKQMEHLLENAIVGDKFRQRDGKIVTIVEISKAHELFGEQAKVVVFKDENGSYSSTHIMCKYDVVEKLNSIKTK